MGLSKETRIKIFIAVDVAFFLLEIIVGYAAHSLALVADAFHMLNDVLSLCVGLWAVRVATQRSSSNEYTYGWARAELIGGLINGVFLVALCLSIFLDAIQRFVEPQEVQNPKIVLIVGGVGLAFNILGLFVFHQHSHDHGHAEEDHADELDVAEHGQSEHQHSVEPSANSDTKPSPSISWQVDGHPAKPQNGAGASQRRISVSSSPSTGRRRSRARSTPDDIPIWPGSIRNEIRKSARGEDEDYGEEETVESDDQDPTETTRLLSPTNSRTSRKQANKNRAQQPSKLDGVIDNHKHHRHNQPQDSSGGHHGHSHSDMNIRGIFLHVLGDALGNIGVMASALIIWLTHSPSRFYADPAISLFITCIILKTAIPMCKETAKPLLQASPRHISVDDIKRDIEDLPGVHSCHHVHVWALTPSKPIATLDVELEFNLDGENLARYMALAKEIKRCLHGYGIHSSTVQPEFCLSPEHKDIRLLKLDGQGSDSSGTTVQTAIAVGSGESSARNATENATQSEHATCLLDCKDECAMGKQCCGPRADDSGSSTPKKNTEADRER